MTNEQAEEMRSLEAAMLALWDARRDIATIAEQLGMDEGDVMSMLAPLLEARREVREPSRFVSPPRRGTNATAPCGYVTGRPRAA